MIVISNFFFNFINICVTVSFLTKLLILGILFSTALRAVLVIKLVILGIFPLTSFILVLGVVLVAKVAIQGILSLVFFLSLPYIHLFLTTASFTTSSIT